MQDAMDIPNDGEACRTLIQAQAVTIAALERTIEEQGLEMEKLRKLLSRFVNGHRSEKRIITDPDQEWLPFANHEELLAARAEAEAQAEAIIQRYTVEREIKKKQPRDESLPGHLRRE